MSFTVTVSTTLQVTAAAVFLLKLPVHPGVAAGNKGLFFGPGTHGVRVHLLVTLMAGHATGRTVAAVGRVNQHSAA
jgi:hypothetical protein